MAVRLQMKLGVIAEPDRASDSPDTVVIVEPTIGAIARSKGNLYLIVTSTVSSAKAQEATQLAAESIRGEYYYDESAGIRVCIEKAIASANKRLNHQRDRLGPARRRTTTARSGSAIAVVRNNELYVATIGPAEAYLIRQARLSTLPDPHRERGLPTGDLEPDVWRGEISVGDSLVLVSPNVMTRLVARRAQGRDGHAPPAAGDGAPPPPLPRGRRRGQRRDDRLRGDGGRVDPPVADARPGPPGGAARRRAGPRPDPARRQRQRRRRRGHRPRRAGRKAAAGGVFARARDPGPGPDAPPAGGLSTRHPGLGEARDPAPGRGRDPRARRRDRRPGRPGLQLRRPGRRRAAGLGDRRARRPCGRSAADLGQVFAPGVDLVEGDPSKAMSLLTDAYRAVDAAKTANVPPATLDPLRQQVVGGLDRLFHVVPVGSATAILSFAGAKTPFDIQAMILGPDGDAVRPRQGVEARSTGSTSGRRRRRRSSRQKTKAAGGDRGRSRSCSRWAARDLLIIDDKNVVWRWRAGRRQGQRHDPDGQGRGRRRAGATTSSRSGRSCATPARASTTSTSSTPRSRTSSPTRRPATAAASRSTRQNRLTVARDVSKVDDLLIDGDIFVADGGSLVRFVGGKSEGWETQPPGYTSDSPRRRHAPPRAAPDYALIASASDKRTGVLYAWDKTNGRVVALDKAKGTFIEQYRLAGGSPAWDDVRGMYVVLGSGPEAPSTLVWATKDGVMSAVLEAVPDAAAGRVRLAEPVGIGAGRLGEAVRQADEGDAEADQASVTGPAPTAEPSPVARRP